MRLAWSGLEDSHALIWKKRTLKNHDYRMVLDVSVYFLFCAIC